ncbi:MAG: hypothetical protein FWC91_02520 [Defluviitaleaceae bacterium]|nr:hypothetical protein [Defluviitaleaceae bacterium]
MSVDTLIDKLTPCLIDTSTGKILPTIFSIASSEEITGLQSKGWAFDWDADELGKTNVYKLLIKGDTTLQALIATEVFRGAVYIHLLESAPHNRGENKQYEGVGGHLFAIAMRLSMALGFGGYIFFDAKNMELVKHYSDMLGANRLYSPVHEYRMEVQEEDASKIISRYTMEGDLNVV